MNKDAKIYVAGHRGMVGSAIVRKLKCDGYLDIFGETSCVLDLRNQRQVNEYFDRYNPEYVFVAAARVGGILANNNYRADFIYSNIMMATNIIHAARIHKIKKLLFLGSSCIYPNYSIQPIKEECLLTGPFEPTNEPYAIAKIAGIKLCQAYKDQYGCNFISVMPPNLYGPGDNYDLKNSHVLPALLKKIHLAKRTNQPYVQVWGTGTPLREFMYVDDLADACLFLMQQYNGREIINAGTEEEITIDQLAVVIKNIIGYKGELIFDNTKPDGMMRKIMDSSRIHALGWKHKIGLVAGIETTYEDFKKRIKDKNL